LPAGAAVGAVPNPVKSASVALYSGAGASLNLNPVRPSGVSRPAPMSRDASAPPPSMPNPAPASPTSLSYRDAGVDIDAGDALVERIKPFAKRTMRPEVLAGIGGFGALVELPKRFREPVLVSGTDGVGTKLKIAFALRRHDTIGIDLVAMSVNDILVQGAEPLFFLDYYVCERLEVAVAAEVIKGIAAGCEQAGCALIGGETAEHPDAFVPGEYDLAGFAVGVVEKARAIDGTRIRAGDVLLGLASSGPHSNGFSLIRRIVDVTRADLGQPFSDAAGARTLGDALLEPTRIYVKPVLALLEDVDAKGMAHITGGGLVENTHRMFPADLGARLERDRWPRPPIFDWLQRAGNVADDEMHRVFNCGIGMVIVVAPADAERAAALLVAAGETVFRIGAVVPRAAGAPATVVT
jgi:phosphoribosylformylglycinamidine cyclo-ligase